MVEKRRTIILIKSVNVPEHIIVEYAIKVLDVDRSFHDRHFAFSQETFQLLKSSFLCNIGRIILIASGDDNQIIIYLLLNSKSTLLQRNSLNLKVVTFLSQLFQFLQLLYFRHILKVFENMFVLIQIDFSNLFQLLHRNITTLKKFLSVFKIIYT